MNKVLSITFILIMFVQKMTAQQTSDKINVIPPSPTAGAMSKVGEIPLNYSTGTANIGIPLIEVTEGALKLPVSISYNYTGYKPDEPSSVVGLGWTLVTGGVISRSVRGLKDESQYGFFNVGNWVKTNISNYQNALITLYDQFFYDINNGVQDGEPDMFNFNFMGNSGQFFMGTDGQFHIISQKKLKFDYVVSVYPLDVNHPVDGESIIEWSVIDENGTKYKFKHVEYGWSLFEGDSFNHFKKAITGWYLSEIVNTRGDKVTLQYTPLNFMNPRITASYTESLTYNVGYDPVTEVTEHQGTNRNYSEEIFVSKISGKNWDLDFEYTDYSQSILGGNFTSHLKKLSKIKYYDKISTPGSPILNKEIQFTISGNGPLLTEIKEVSGSAKNNVHKFSYLSDVPGSYLMGTKAIDYWGYFNGVENNHLIPDFGADREPNYANASAGLLSNIIYPTGGSVSFEYEKNQYSYLGPQAFQAIRRRKEMFDFQYQNGQVLYGSGTTINVPYPTEYKTIVTVENGTIEDVVHCPKNTSAILSPGNYTAMSFPPLMSTTCLNLETLNDPSKIINVRLILTRIDTTIKNDYGGFRVKTITTTVNSNEKYFKNFEYDYFWNKDLSSGAISSLGNYGFTQRVLLALPPRGSWLPNKDPAQPTINITMYLYTSEPHNSMQLSPLMYFNVNEYTTSLNNEISQESKHYFNTYADGFTDEYGTSDFYTDKFGPAESFDFARGSEKLVERLRSGDGLVLEKEASEYTTKGDLMNYFSNYYFDNCIFNKFLLSLTFRLPTGDKTSKLFYNKFYRVFSTWPRIKSKQTTTYGANSSSYTDAITTYHYDNLDHMQVSRTRTTKSNGDIIETKTTYPLDYKNTPGLLPVLQKMIDSNMVTYPVENIEIIEKNTNTKMIRNATLSLYKEFTGNPNKSNLILPYKNFNLQTLSAPLPMNSYPVYNGTTDQISASVFREAVRYDQYDKFGNPLSLVYNNNESINYLWSYNSQYPVAEIKNVTYQEIVNGLSSVGSGITSFGGLTSSGSIQTILNALRSGLPSSLITSILYQPLIGVKTQTSPDGVSTHFEYDPFNRLFKVKDNNLKTVKRINYNYTQN